MLNADLRPLCKCGNVALFVFILMTVSLIYGLVMERASVAVQGIIGNSTALKLNTGKQ